jgi:arylsulfatase A-like enzyme
MTRIFAFGLFGLSLFTGCGGPAPPKKNVVLVVIDTLRADRTSLYGGERSTTPAVDEWAQRGAVFERANSASSWTVPSMGMLLTGRYRLGGGKTLSDSQRLLSQVLQGAGYRTVGIVANPVLNSLQGFDVGYEQYDLTEGDYETALTERRWGWPGSVVVDKGIRWMREFRDERPFMLYLHLMDPHFPYAPVEGVPFMWEEGMSSERRARFEAKLAEGDAGAITENLYKGMERMLAAYDAEILQADQELERLFDYLDESGLSEETVVVLTSDHGEGLWEHTSKDGWVNEASFSQSIVPELYRGHGEQLFGELVHVPLAFVGPGVPAGVREQRPVSLVDVVPTILSLVDVASPTELHGLPLFGDPDLDAREEIYSRCARGTTITLNGRWKLHVPEDHVAERGGVTALYDLDVDPGEDRPVADPEMVQELKARVIAWTAQHTEHAEQMSLEDQRALLLQMGYVGLAEDLDKETTREEAQRAMRAERERRKAEESAGD